MCIIAVDILRGFRVILLVAFLRRLLCEINTRTLNCDWRDLVLPARGVNSRFFSNKRNCRKKDYSSLEAPSFSLLYDLFSLLVVITGWSRLTLLLLLYLLKMHYLLPICKEWFSFHCFTIAHTFISFFFLTSSSSSSFDCFGSLELNSSALRTKNHSSSFSAKKKRKKSVITFNFDHSTNGLGLFPRIFSKACSTRKFLTRNAKTRTNSLFLYCDLVQILFFCFTTYVFQRRWVLVSNLSRGSWRNGISQVGETCFQQKFKQTKLIK